MKGSNGRAQNVEKDLEIKVVQLMIVIIKLKKLMTIMTQKIILMILKMMIHQTKHLNVILQGKRNIEIVLFIVQYIEMFQKNYFLTILQ